jgi:pimeloyl-ACP methyl ester carboxylesterase
MPYLSLPDYRCYYEEHGEGSALFLLHGFTVDRRMWGPQIKPLGSEFRVITPDARGHGLSGAPGSGYSRADRVEDLRRTADSLNINRFHLLGLSMGGSTAIGFALKYQDRLKSLTLVSSGAAGYNAGKKIERLDRLAREEGVEAARAAWLKWTMAWYDPSQSEIAALMKKMISDHSGAVWRDPMRGRYPREFDLDRVDQITVPTLILTGSGDRVFAELGEKLHERIKASRLEVLDGIGHMVNLEAPERFNRICLEFLRGNDRP